MVGRRGIIQAAQVLQTYSIKVRQLVMFFRVMCHKNTGFAICYSLFTSDVYAHAMLLVIDT
jgi:hypothetical protein